MLHIKDIPFYTVLPIVPSLNNGKINTYKNINLQWAG